MQVRLRADGGLDIRHGMANAAALHSTAQEAAAALHSTAQEAAAALRQGKTAFVPYGSYKLDQLERALEAQQHDTR